jgi:hypothetical protein
MQNGLNVRSHVTVEFILKLRKGAFNLNQNNDNYKFYLWAETAHCFSLGSQELAHLRKPTMILKILNKRITLKRCLMFLESKKVPRNSWFFEET